MTFQRPDRDFWVTDLRSDLDIVRRQTQAGFAPIPRGVVRLRLFILLDFLWSRKLLVRPLARRVHQIRPDLALRNRHLTDQGYYFLQKYLGRWQGRLYKHTTEEKERAFLEKWYRQFASR